MKAGTGSLRNGNPPGDLRLAARCGARTRAGHPCRQPAMKNGRCRLHGGKSTGPRTAAGRERCRRARWVHGGRSAAFAGMRREGAARRRRIRALCAAIAAERKDVMRGRDPRISHRVAETMEVPRREMPGSGPGMTTRGATEAGPACRPKRSLGFA